MKKSKLFLQCTLISSLVISGSFAGANTAYAKETDPFSDTDTLTRVYDSQTDNRVSYHYEDQNNKTVEPNGTGSEDSDSTAAKNQLKTSSSIPSSFDLRTANLVTSIKDQGVSGCCWGFAAIKSLESNLLLQGLASADTLDLSENHLTWFSFHPSADKSDPLYGEGLSSTSSCYLLGGNAIFAEFILARGSGAVSESSAPFSALTESAITDMENTMSSSAETLRYQSDYQVNDVTCYDNATRDQIKEALMAAGAMDVAFYYNPNYEHQTGQSTIAYFQNLYQGDDAISMANHCVTIVGWDDTYSKENFGTSQPASDGAWLIANSYGTEYGDSGYFWLSYEEPSLTEYYSFSGSTGETYDNTYQYDAFGWGTLITNTGSSTSMGANIFTANKSYIQSLGAVGIYTGTDNQSYTVSVYKNVSAGNPTSGTLAAELSGTEAFQGYHTVALSEPVALAPGERFSVVISYNTTTDSIGYIPIEGSNAQSGSVSLNYTSNAGESFLYMPVSSVSASGWLDLNVYGSGTIKNNICLKAFTTNTGNAGTLSLSTKKATLGKGETLKVKGTVSGISDKTVTYKSNKPSVATITANGKIKAKKAGTAKISVTSASGLTKTIKITVKKAPKKSACRHPVKRTSKKESPSA
ncbi:MAG: lectin like domain-containing protein [Clostridiaceae bacterium]|nr:lectin like domain-containing protein [Clostridiaceae bacterium]